MVLDELLDMINNVNTYDYDVNYSLLNSCCSTSKFKTLLDVSRDTNIKYELIMTVVNN